jgi:hypothetical protein
MSDEARRRIAEDLRRAADRLDSLARSGGCSRAETMAREAAEVAIYATRRILAAAEHCPDLLDSLRPGQWGARSVAVVCPGRATATDLLTYWTMCALPWLRSCRAGELPANLNTLPAPHWELGKMTVRQQRKLKRLAAASQRAINAARRPQAESESQATDGPRPWSGRNVDLPAIQQRIDQEDPTPLDVPPVYVEPEGYDAGWALDDKRRLAFHWAVAMRVFSRLIDANEQAGPLPAEQPLASLGLAPGGFTLGGKRHSLTGRPLEMLRVLLASPDHTATADHLRKEMGVNDEAVTYPEQVIRDTAKKLRAALRGAAEAAGRACPPDPLPSTGRGRDLTYRLAIK